jgi:hypothetical protein
VQLDYLSDWSIINERMTRSRGKNTCEAPEIAAAIRLQVDRRSEEFWLFEGSGKPYESDARENAQSRSAVKVMSDPVLGRGQPSRKGKFFI